MSGEIIAAIDIGTTKVCTLIANSSPEYGIQILGAGQVPPVGLYKGVVANLDQARETIAESLRRAEKASGLKVESVLIGITVRPLHSLCSFGISQIPRKDRLIQPLDTKRVLKYACHITIPDDRGILYAIPRNTAEICAVAITFADNLIECVSSCGIDVDDLIVEPVAVGEAVLKPDEKERGVILADIGGGITDIAVFKEGIVYHTSYIPLAGHTLTSDISIGLGLPFDIGENVKKKYGNVSPEFSPFTDEIAINMKDGNRHSISHHELNRIIKDRVEEVLKLILLEMPGSDCVSLVPAGLVLVGGSSNLPGLDSFARSKLNIPVRIGKPMGIYGPDDVLNDASYATGIGLLICGIRKSWVPTLKAPKHTDITSIYCILIKHFFGPLLGGKGKFLKSSV